MAQPQERRREPVWQAGEDDQALQHAMAESSSGTNSLRPILTGGLGLRLKKSASLLEWLNKKLAEQGQSFSRLIILLLVKVCVSIYVR